MITFEDIRKNPKVTVFIERGNDVLGVMGYTEHSFQHALKTAETAAKILSLLDYGKRDIELVRIAAFMHDIGNVVNRVDHAHSGALMALQILDEMGMDPNEIASVISAIGNHDEATSMPVNAIAAALILADKSDVRRSRVRNPEFSTFDIHDRVNYAVKESGIVINVEDKTASLELEIDSTICSVMDYFEIFLTRMILCRRAAEFLGLKFELLINNMRLL
jgi:metal-dependent HD superfamily phosphatase/phosphodiesterase